MADFTILLKRDAGIEIVEHAFYREARQCLINAVKADKHVKAYIYSQNAKTWHRYKPSKPFDGSFATYLHPVSQEFLPPEAAFIQI